MLHVRHKDRLRRAVRGPVDDLEEQPALNKTPVKALQRREAAFGARHECHGAAVILFILAADEQQRPESYQFKDCVRLKSAMFFRFKGPYH